MLNSRHLALAALLAVSGCALRAAPTPEPAVPAAATATVTPEAEDKASEAPSVASAQEDLERPDVVTTGEETAREALQPGCPDEPSDPNPNPAVLH